MDLFSDAVEIDNKRAVLQSMLEKAQAVTALLITKDGTGLAEAGDLSYLNPTAMAALVAGMFSATREVARMVGEEKFSILLQQGENRHIHISLVTDAVMLVVVFDDYQRIGRVRFEAKKILPALVRALEPNPTQDPISEQIPVTEFKEYAIDLIDRIFVSQ